MKEYIITADDVKAIEEEFGINLSFEKDDELIRCKDCKHRPRKDERGRVSPPIVQAGAYSWGEPIYNDDETCPYICEDCTYNRMPSDEQYCDKAELKEEKSK